MAAMPGKPRIKRQRAVYLLPACTQLTAGVHCVEPPLAWREKHRAASSRRTAHVSTIAQKPLRHAVVRA